MKAKTFILIALLFGGWAVMNHIYVYSNGGFDVVNANPSNNRLFGLFSGASAFACFCLEALIILSDTTEKHIFHSVDIGLTEISFGAFLSIALTTVAFYYETYILFLFSFISFLAFGCYLVTKHYEGEEDVDWCKSW